MRAKRNPPDPRELGHLDANYSAKITAATSPQSRLSKGKRRGRSARWRKRQESRNRPGS